MKTTFLGQPRALLPLFGTELWERFSYYGIRPLLILFMTASLMSGGMGFDRPTAAAITGIFAGAVYLAALPGGWLADRVLGQARSVWWGSVLIGLGHLSIGLSVWLGHVVFFAGLGLIVLGTGLFKTCISVLVGRLYTPEDPRRDGGFSIFYMGINLGAFAAPLITGLLAQQLGWHWGFAAGGVGMLIALLIYRLSGKAIFDRLADEPSQVSSRFIITATAILLALVLLVIVVFNLFTPVQVVAWMTGLIVLCVAAYLAGLMIWGGLHAQDKKRVLLCGILFVAATVFWAANEQQPTALNLFAQDFIVRNVGDFVIPVVWFQSINPITIILFAPLMGLLWQRWPSQDLASYLSKFALGLLIVAVSFGLMWLASRQVLAGTSQVAAAWLVATYILQAIAELCISPVGLAAMTLLAPPRLQGQMMGLWFIAASLGNLLAGMVGGQVNPEALSDMPQLFGRTAIVLIVSAAVLLALIPMIRRWLNADTHSPMV